ncbi:MAG TPA: secretion protein HlyD [Nitrosomonas europaea]|uniref:HlyD family secretion protein n=2 Tax=Nitrosomonas europaea TaxID=915 RepID=Q82V90_NITEU|nr:MULTISPECIES: secretion protein HlyD [Nitrosomonas]CAD85119.1 HlyD family secretion protein [Nitrosomonas europaea ATCC 19718]SDW38708.1 HlyD family secretion protein [Nitrosomonas europaea]SET02379.1 HlyD family secretion protein [Nitrosomonas europaea]SJZ51759.1 HlyD family secretion protein [Nitrosomonas europaea]HBF24857.1 secretion protein HlyD [Nitrosomonas sp.]
MKMGSLSRTVKRILIITVILLAAGSAVFSWVLHTEQDESLLYLYGNVDIREVQLAFRQPGRVAQMMFDEGDAVVAGTRMATLDAQPYQEAFATAEASVRVAQAELAKMRRGLRPQEIIQAQEALNQAQAVARRAERDYVRLSRLLPSKASSQQDVDNARAARDQAIAGVKAAKAALSQAREGFRKEDIAAAEAQLAAAMATRDQAATALADTELFAPSDGTVITRIREPGSMVVSQSAVYNLSLDKPVYVRAYIGETALGRIAPGTPVQVRSDSSKKIYHGQIGFISPRAEFTPKTVETTDLRTDLVYRLRIVVSDADAALRQGMPITIEVDTRPAADLSAKDL